MPVTVSLLRLVKQVAEYVLTDKLWIDRGMLLVLLFAFVFSVCVCVCVRMCVPILTGKNLY